MIDAQRCCWVVRSRAVRVGHLPGRIVVHDCLFEQTLGCVDPSGCRSPWSEPEAGRVDSAAAQDPRRGSCRSGCGIRISSCPLGVRPPVLIGPNRKLVANRAGHRGLRWVSDQASSAWITRAATAPAPPLPARSDGRLVMTRAVLHAGQWSCWLVREDL